MYYLETAAAETKRPPSLVDLLRDISLPLMLAEHDSSISFRTAQSDRPVRSPAQVT